MKEPNNTSTETLFINETRLQIKARPDDSDVNPSGWSIIAFTHSASIRCVRPHQAKHLDRFVHAIIALCHDPKAGMGDELIGGDVTLHDHILDTIMKTTNNTFVSS